MKKSQLAKISANKLSMRESIFPSIDPERLWRYKGRAGFLSVPRAMPLILRIADMMAPKGKPVSPTYFDLWCRTFDDSFVIASRTREMAYYSGFTGERAEHTWSTRMKLLQSMGFIDIKPGPHGAIHYILLFNPYHVIKQQFDKGEVPEAAYNALKARALEIKALDLQQVEAA